jgi:hypothetical protein
MSTRLSDKEYGLLANLISHASHSPQTQHQYPPSIEGGIIILIIHHLRKIPSGVQGNIYQLLLSVVKLKVQW